MELQAGKARNVINLFSYQNQVDATFVIEISEKAENVWMAQVGLDLDLPSQLVLHLSFLKLRLE